jgi:hypothetical protein
VKYPLRNPPGQLSYYFTEARRSQPIATQIYSWGLSATGFLRSFGIGLPQSDTGATAVFVDELNTLADQDVSNQRERSGIPCIPTDLDVRNGIPMKSGRRC